MNKGIFITFEGPEGSGKTTHARLLVDYLKKKGEDVVYTREPGGTPIGAEIRKILLTKDMDALTEAFLYVADRREHVVKVIRPALSSGKIVISDRYFFSSWAYQGWGRGLKLQTVWELSMLATERLMPDFTFIMDIPVEEGLARLKEKDRLESEDIEFHKKVRQGFLELAKMFPEKVFVVSTKDEPQEKVFEKILSLLRERWPERF